MLEESKPAILSLFDYTGNWSRPYHEQGYEVVTIDIQSGQDIVTWDYRKLPRNYFAGILAAVPCTDFSLSGARWFKEKDENGQTYESMALTYKTLAIIQWFMPGLRFWAIENPMSRIHKLCPELEGVKFSFDPFEFAGYDPVPRNSQYQKRTWLWGKFNLPVKKPLLNVDASKFHRLGGKSLKTKNTQSATPLGFAYAFAQENG